jgi:hypothetical protein
VVLVEVQVSQSLSSCQSGLSCYDKSQRLEWLQQLLLEFLVCIGSSLLLCMAMLECGNRIGITFMSGRPQGNAVALSSIPARLGARNLPGTPQAMDYGWPATMTRACFMFVFLLCC